MFEISYPCGQDAERKKEKKVKSLSRVRLFAAPWAVAYQAPPSMGFSRQECWSGLPFPSPGDLPDPGIEPGSPALQADALLSEPPGKTSDKLYLHIPGLFMAWSPESLCPFQNQKMLFSSFNHRSFEDVPTFLPTASSSNSLVKLKQHFS